MLDTYLQIEIPNEKIRLHCPIASQTWLKHLLLVLGSNSKLIEIPFEEQKEMRTAQIHEIIFYVISQALSVPYDNNDKL